jgi:hypothetical protein
MGRIADRSRKNTFLIWRLLVMGNAFSLSPEDFKKLGMGMLIAISGAVLTYGTEWVSGTSFGLWTPLIVAGWSVTANLLRKFVTDTTKPDTPPA